MRGIVHVVTNFVIRVASGRTRLAVAEQLGRPSVSKITTFWAPLRPMPPAMPLGKVMGELTTNDLSVVSRG